MTNYFKIIAKLLMLFLPIGAAAQHVLWLEVPEGEIFEDSLLTDYYRRHLKNPANKQIRMVVLNVSALQEKVLEVPIEGRKLTIRHIATEQSQDKSIQTWFGASMKSAIDGARPDFYFTQHGNLVACKFLYGQVPYTLMPLYKQYHILIEHYPDKLPDVCASHTDNSYFEEGVKRYKTVYSVQKQPNYQLRMMMAFSQLALSRLRFHSATFSAAHFAEYCVQESNLLHLRKEVAFKLQLASVTYLSYSEAEMQRDLQNMISEKMPFDMLKQLRVEHTTDVQVLIRSNEDSLAGISATTAEGVAMGKAYCVMSVDGAQFAPFALKHQVEHLVRDWQPSEKHLLGAGYSDPEIPEPHWQFHAFARHDWYFSGIQKEATEALDSLPSMEVETMTNSRLPIWDVVPINEPSAYWSFVEEEQKNNGKTTAKKMRFVILTPNPTKGETFLEYSVQESNRPVRVTISTLTGELVQFLVDDSNHSNGDFQLKWDASWLPNGIYLCQLRADGQAYATRIVVSH